MINVLSTNITSPLGLTTDQNYQALKAGRSAISCHENWHGIPDPIAGAFFGEEQIEALMTDGCTRFESLVIASVSEALSHTSVDVKSSRTLFILSTTKANVSELKSDDSENGQYLFPGQTARKIAERLGFASTPIVVCNACISGVTAQVLAQRLIQAGYYDTAVICGADVLSLFTVSGFLSFKSLSPYACKPFDIERLGLNIGEAAATIIYGKTELQDSAWHICATALNNDAYHISAPSPNGDGTGRAIEEVMKDFPAEQLATICAHGTATMFNDQMESKAIERAGLSAILVSALKGYYGHTLGASGVLETIVTMRSIDEGLILPTLGYEEIGVSGKITISPEMQQTDKDAFLKIISGFGGCNGAILFSKSHNGMPEKGELPQPRTLHTVHITTTSAQLDGQEMTTEQTGKQLLTELYKKHIGNYPKFYKMDMLSRLVFLASELLIAQDTENRDGENRSIILFNRSSSIVTDKHHLASIEDKDNFFPSPSIFVYTLPNIVTGEIAIKHQYHGETSLYILDEKDDEMISRVTLASFLNTESKTMLTGWVDCPSENTFEAKLSILTI